MVWVLLYYALELLKWLILARVLMSWFVSPYSTHPVVNLLRRVTDPVLRPFQEMVPNLGGFDLSPILAFFALYLLQSLLVRMA